jgi:hypothetical protein
MKPSQKRIYGSGRYQYTAMDGVTKRKAIVKVTKLPCKLWS